jgi:F-type H+-transporting ATPase subunit beta
MKGTILQIIGPVIDVEFKEGTALPQIYNALTVKSPLGRSQTGEAKGEVVLEVVKHLDTKSVRTISLQSTDGLQRGLEVTTIPENRLRFP